MNKNNRQPHIETNLSTPKFSSTSARYNTENFCKEPMDTNKDINTSASVANCIRALSQKTSALMSENQVLKNQNSELLAQIKSLQSKEHSEDTANIISSYKEKCLILEQSNELFQKKLGKLEEVNIDNESLRSELILINKELLQEIERNQSLNSLTKRLKEEKMYLQAEIEHLSTKLIGKKEENLISKSLGHSATYYEDQKLKDYEKRTKILEEVLEKQEKDLEDKRKTIESQKQQISDLESSIYHLKKQETKTQLFATEITEANDKLLKALKKKNHCKHRAMTPDILSQKNVSKSQSGPFDII